MARTKAFQKLIPLGALYLYGDSIIQLKDGRLVSFYLRRYGIINIYNQNTFTKILNIDLIQIIKNEKKDDNSNYDTYFESKISIKQLNNDLILIGFNKYLFEINLHENNFEYKIYQREKNILEINELSDKRIFVLTEDKIEILMKEKDEYILNKIYKINENWKISPMSLKDKNYKYFSQYYYSYILPNGKLLLKSFAFEELYKDFPKHHPKEFIHSKIIFIDLKNFKEIQSTKEFNKEAKYIILDDYIVIQGEDKVYLYDINKLFLINEFNYKYDNFLYKYSNNYLITASVYEKENNFLVFKIEQKNFIHTCTIKTQFKFYEISINGDKIINYNNKILLTLKDKRIILFCHECIYVLQIDVE